MKTTKSALKYPAMTQKGKDDEYISGLQRQVYYLELEMKLMKDREAETKNKVGGYEVLFRDGVPLNENFLAIKTVEDIDIGELKMLTQNNAIVNNSINTLITKWDKVHAKLSEIEQKNLIF